jgi:hypothetical protein
MARRAKPVKVRAKKYTSRQWRIWKRNQRNRSKGAGICAKCGKPGATDWAHTERSLTSPVKLMHRGCHTGMDNKAGLHRAR